MLIRYLLVFLIAITVSLVLQVLFKRISLKRKLLIKEGVPAIGGIAIGLAFFLASFLSLLSCPGLPSQVLGIIIASFIILVFGIIDDVMELSISVKFLMQISSVAVLVLFGVRTHIVGIGTFANLLVTFIWMLGITNSFNHLDVLDGLAGGVAVVAGSAFFIVSLLNADFVSAVLSLALVSSVLGFLVFNLPPAKVYMGNAGSHFLGFSLGAVALTISYAQMHNKVALLSPILILGFPVIDTILLIILRLRKKIIPFKKSNDHPVLKFLLIGYSKRRALLVMLAWCLFFSFFGVALSQVSNILGVVLIIFSILAAALFFRKVSKAEVNG